MAVGQVAARTRVLAADHNSLVNLLQGASGETLAFLLRVAASNNFTIVLSDNAGARKFSVKDSDSVEIFAVDSNGNITNSGTYSPTTLVLPQAAAPAPTAEGDIRWDTDDNRIVVGDGSGQKTFFPGAGFELVGSNTTEQTTTSTSEVSLVTVTLTRSVQPTEWLLIQWQTRRTAGHASGVQTGLMLNATQVWTAFEWDSAALQAESAHFTAVIPAYVAAYATTLAYALHPMIFRNASIGIGMNVGSASRPSAAITSVVIRAKVTNALNTQGVQEVRVYAMGST